MSFILVDKTSISGPSEGAVTSGDENVSIKCAVSIMFYSSIRWYRMMTDPDDHHADQVPMDQRRF